MQSLRPSMIPRLSVRLKLCSERSDTRRKNKHDQHDAVYSSRNSEYSAARERFEPLLFSPSSCLCDLSICRGRHKQNRDRYTRLEIFLSPITFSNCVVASPERPLVMFDLVHINAILGRVYFDDLLKHTLGILIAAGFEIDLAQREDIRRRGWVDVYCSFIFSFG